MGCGTVIIGVVILAVLSHNNAPISVYVAFVAMCIIFAKLMPKPAEAPQPILPDPEPIDREEIEAEVRAKIVQEYAVTLREISRRERRLTIMENEISLRQRKLDPTARDLKPGSLKLIRNTLMLLHEARRTDAEYQRSETNRHATAILQGLNSLIDKSK